MSDRAPAHDGADATASAPSNHATSPSNHAAASSSHAVASPKPAAASSIHATASSDHPAAPWTADAAQALPSWNNAASSATRWFHVLGAAALVIVGLHVGQPILMPLALAALLAFVLDPLVTRLRRIGAPTALAVALVVSLTLALLVSLAALGAQQLAALSRDLPTYQSTIQNKLRELRPAPGSGGLLAGASRLIAAIEGEIDAARSALEPQPAGAKSAPTRVLVEPVPPSPLRALGDMAAPLTVPLAAAGLVIVLLAYMLAQRREISDRLIRITGGDLHRMADAVNDAARRVSRYLIAQVLVNVGYGIPLALGLVWIGVPGAWLWGALAAALRFVPYLGPLIAAVLPLLLAFAVDSGWSMVLWTGALILVLELVVNNIVEPLVYSGTTGVSPVAVLLSAVFWMLVWGPMGLVLATPLTVCLVVLGRHLGALRFLDVLLGSGPAFDTPTLLYRRLISGDRDEAVVLAADEAERSGLNTFYSTTGVPMLALAAAWSARHASAKQRHRVLSGAARIVEELRVDHESAPSPSPRVLCVGARTEWDNLSAEMLAHALAHDGVAVKALPAVAIGADRIATLALGSGDGEGGDGVDVVVLCSFHPEPQTHARFVSKRLKRRSPNVRIVLAAWGAAASPLALGALEAIGVDAIALTLDEAAARATSFSAAVPKPAHDGDDSAAPAIPADTAIAASQPSPSSQAAVAAPGDEARERLSRAAQRTAEVFSVPLASVLWRDPSGHWIHEAAGRAQWTQGDDAAAALRDASPCAAVLERGEALAVRDVSRVPEWAAAPGSRLEGLVAFAGVPLRDPKHGVCGVLAVHDAVARDFSADELELLAKLAVAIDAELAVAAHAAAEAAAAEGAAAEAAAAEAAAAEAAAAEAVAATPASAALPADESAASYPVNRLGPASPAQHAA